MTHASTDPAARRDWSWLPQHMPGVARLISEHRQRDGAAWVQECWRRGVLEGQPGYLWACEGPLCLGTPPAAWVEPTQAGQRSGQADWVDLQRKHPGACLLLMPSSAQEVQP